MIQRQRENLIRREPGAVFIHNAKPVGVAIQAKAELALPLRTNLLTSRHAFGVRFGMMPAKQRIQFVMENRDFCARFFESLSR